MFELEIENNVKNLLKRVENDKIVKILLEKSNLTEIQFETFLIDLFYRQNFEKNTKKHQLRLNKTKISRGSFNRTRKQAIDNIVKSIYTILLLGYYGILETPQLEPFIEGANRLRSFIELIREKDSTDIEKNLELLADIIKNELDELSSRKLYYK